MCSVCGSYVALIYLGSFLLLGFLVYALVDFISQKRRIRDRMIRMHYLEVCLHRIVVHDPNELECLVEYIQLLDKLGFKSEEIQRKVLSCCLRNDLENEKR